MKRFFVSKTFPLCLYAADAGGHLISESWSSLSKSHNLLLQTGLIHPCSSGLYHYTPPLQRSLSKLECIIDRHLSSIGGQKMQMASLAPESLWKKTSRWTEFGNELIKTQIGNNLFCLSPTHEEAICSIISSYVKKLSHSHLPLRLYQTTSKHRGEQSPHSGLLRSREFLMNDLYTFDVNSQSAMETYNEVNAVYDAIFAEIGVKVLKAKAHTGLIGGTVSDEYLLASDIGEDQILVDKKTGMMFNRECKDTAAPDSTVIKAIEVAHSFLLGDKYSKLMRAEVVAKGGTATPCEMGCYGIGVSRLIAACVEVLSTNEHMRWPVSLAPYKVCIIPPKKGSLEEKSCDPNLTYEIYDNLQSISSVKNDVIIDDRTSRTVGWRLAQANIIGYPLIIVIGKSVKEEEPKLELLLQRDTTEASYLPINSVYDFVKNQFDKPRSS